MFSISRYRASSMRHADFWVPTTADDFRSLLLGDRKVLGADFGDLLFAISQLPIRICSFSYQATVGNDNAVRHGGMILDIPAGPRRRGYAKARVEVRQLLDGRWRIYHKDELLVETAPPVIQAPLRTFVENIENLKLQKNRQWQKH